ncbi:N-acetylmuramoyl-L-alanine amidase [Streptomyces sp. NPDC086182]|uniref:peptidoglycan recognition protein family protein n=1 Tax=Streptomyces sp. NPDC086182 TaxID=3155058 RepID=UPI0034151150
MARMPGAVWRPVVNCHPDGVREHRGLVLHVQDGNNSPFGWFNNPASQSSSDFWVSKTGVIEQYVDTGVDYAWAQAAGNPYYASVETEGHPDEPLTPAQVDGVAKIYAWGHGEFAWPLTVVDSTSAHGLTWHGVGGTTWGGHTGCPGDLRKAQRAKIIARAAGAPTEEDPMAGITKQDIYDAVWKTDQIAGPSDAPDAATNPTWQPQSWLKDIGTRVRAIQATESAQSAAIAALAGQLGKNVDTATVVAAVEKAIAAAVVHVHVDVTGQES